MKQLFLLLFLVSGMLSAQEIPNSQARIRRVQERFYTIVGEEGQQQRKLKYLYSPSILYNEQGKKQEERYYDAKGKLVYKVLYVYDANGKLLREDTYNKKEIQKGSKIHQYNEQGTCSETLVWQNGIVHAILMYQYDANGNIIQQEEYNHRRKLNYRFEFLYDEHGNKVECKYYKPNGKHIDYETYKYGDFTPYGHWQKQVAYNSEGRIIYVIERNIVYYE